MEFSLESDIHDAGRLRATSSAEKGAGNIYAHRKLFTPDFSASTNSIAIHALGIEHIGDPLATIRRCVAACVLKVYERLPMLLCWD